MKGKAQRPWWTIDLAGPACPDCGRRPPVLRVPDSLRQALWGGWTCEECGCVMDRVGKPLKAGGDLRSMRQSA